MSELSDYLEKKLLDHSLGVAAFTMPATLYLALYTDDPTDADSGTEVSTSGTAYARQVATFNAAASPAGTSSNNGDVSWPAATANWGTVTHVGVRDAASGGNLLWHTILDDSKTVNTDDVFKVNDGDLDFTLA